MKREERSIACTTCGAAKGVPCMKKGSTTKALPISHLSRRNTYARSMRRPLHDK